MTGDAPEAGPVDVPTLELLGRRAAGHPLVERWRLRPDAVSPRSLALVLDEGQYLERVGAARMDARWYEGGAYALHYVETGDDWRWQCRWDRHPEPDAPVAHVHPPPAAGDDVEPSPIDPTHPLGVCFAVLDAVTDRLEGLHGEQRG